ncbi:MAG: c-type cytochrome [Phycisphaerales bacterium]|nr:c-type cytochrome [Phycisphaerales bacterium]MCI0676559.1 c-type cytochrome [Phycisphaerales bacterium]
MRTISAVAATRTCVIVTTLAGGSLVWMSMSAAYGEGGGGAVKPWIVPARAAQKKNPVAADEKSLTLGQQLYVRECRSCHGAAGRGDGKAGIDLEPRPTNLTEPSLWDQSDGAMFWKITEGRGDMPGHKELLTDAERWHVLNYMRSLAPRPPAKEPEFEAPPACGEALSSVVHRYLDLHGALVRSDLNTAQNCCGSFASTLSELAQAQSALDEARRAAWKSDVEAIQKAQAAVSDSSSDLVSLRSAFRDLSASLAQALRHFGHAEASPVLAYEVGQGANSKMWLQAFGPAENPYGRGAPAPDMPCNRFARIRSSGAARVK